jgi:hypothetical protein
MGKTSEIGGLISAIKPPFPFLNQFFLCFWWWDSWKICGNGFAFAGFLELELDFLYWCFCWVFNRGHL